MSTSTQTPPRELRLTMRVLTYWREVAGSREFPQPSDIAGEKLGEDWKNCMLIKVDPASELSTFLFVGGELRLTDGSGFEGQSVSACGKDTILRQATAFMATVLSKRVPISMSGAATHLGAPILYRSILMPLSTDGHTIDGLLGATNFREVRPREETHPS
jgi:hypothetical protein